MILIPPQGTRYSISHLSKGSCLVEFYRLAGSRWISVAHCVCEGDEDVEKWLNDQFAPVLFSQLPPSYSSDVS